MVELLWGYRFQGSYGFQTGPPLGLGDLNLTASEHQVAAPSHMYAVADTRPLWNGQAGGFVGQEPMIPWQLVPSLLRAKYLEANRPHSGGYIQPDNLTRIFAHGFTTRKNGRGFGLHTAALAAQELGGSLTVRSDVPDKGATFTFILPPQAAAKGQFASY